MREHLDILALGLGDIVALLLVLSPAFLSGVIHGAAARRVLGPALLLVVSLLQELIGIGKLPLWCNLIARMLI